MSKVGLYYVQSKQTSFFSREKTLRGTASCHIRYQLEKSSKMTKQTVRLAVLSI